MSAERPVRRHAALAWLTAGAALIAVSAAMVVAGIASLADPTLGGGGRDDAGLEATANTEPVAPGTAVLTFEGALDREGADTITSILAKANVPATFFLTGASMLQDPSVARDLVHDGYDVGLVPYTGGDLASMPGLRRTAEVALAQNALISATGTGSTLIRPFGSAAAADGDGVAPGQGELHGYDIVGTGAAPTDWGTPGAPALVAMARPDGTAGTIVSLAASPDQLAGTAAALPAIIDELDDSGYTFSSVPAAVGSEASAMFSPDPARQVTATLGTAAVASSITLVGVLQAIMLVLGIIAMVQLAIICTNAIRQRRREIAAGPIADPYVGGVSIIVPAFNEEANIAATVTSLLASVYPGPIELIVVDDGSTDATPGIVAGFGDAIISVRQQNAGKAAALNNGINRATHPVIVMIDGDTVFDPDCLAELVAGFTDPNVGAISGNTMVANRRGLLGAWQDIEYTMSMALEQRANDYVGGIITIPGANGAFRATALRAIGGVPTETLAEDCDLTLTLQLAGWTITYASRAIAWTEAPATIGALSRQRLRWTYGTLQAVWKHWNSPAASGTIWKRFTLPYVAVNRVVLSVLAPILDLYLLFALFFTDVRVVLAVWLFYNVVLIAVAGLAMRLDGYPLRRVLAAPTMMVVWRQVLYISSLRATGLVFSGLATRWHADTRTGAAADRLAPAPAASAPVPVAS